MYGLIISGLKQMLEEEFGTAVLEEVMRRAGLEEAAFSSHERYSERIGPDVLRLSVEVTGKSQEEIGRLAGAYFVRFICKYGYGELMQVMGRRLADFLKGLDNLHEYFRFSYPKIRPPSFYCDRETASGLILHYRSRRKGYISYVCGQLEEIARVFYRQEIQITLHKQEERGSFQFVLLKVAFDNSALTDDNALRDKSSSLNEFLPVDSYSFLSMFPFFIIFTKKMEIFMVGNAMDKIMPDLQGRRIDEEFELQRPLIKFTWDGCKQHLNNVFKMESTSPIQKQSALSAITFKINDTVEDQVALEKEREEEGSRTDGRRKASKTSSIGEEELLDDARPYLETRGPIVYLRSMEMMVYLPTVSVTNMDNLFDLGLFLDDYSNADCNREIIMASAQKPDSLKALLEGEKEKSRALQALVSDIDVAKKQARELLQQMMPRDVAKSLLSGTGPADPVVQNFDEATVAFAKVLDFNGLTNGLPPMEVVNLLNHIYSTFDDVITRHGVYKVETIGECYMVSCGVPRVTPYHAEYAADTALDMIKMVKEFGPEVMKRGRKVQVKIGMFSGPVVGGVVGNRAPRYCLFGDTVNCASRMESHNKQPMTIQLGDPTKASLQKASPGSFRFESRGKVHLKGKGEMEAFGLLKKSGAPRSRTQPLEDEDSDSEGGHDVYTPVEDRGSEAASRESQMSRMSISAFTRSDGGSSMVSDGSDASRPASQASSNGSTVHHDQDEDPDTANDLQADHDTDSRRHSSATTMLQEELEHNQKVAAAKEKEREVRNTKKASEVMKGMETKSGGTGKLHLPDQEGHKKERQDAKELLRNQEADKAQKLKGNGTKPKAPLPAINGKGSSSLSPAAHRPAPHSPRKAAAKETAEGELGGDLLPEVGGEVGGPEDPPPPPRSPSRPDNFSPETARSASGLTAAEGPSGQSTPLATLSPPPSANGRPDHSHSSLAEARIKTKVCALM